MSMKTPFKGLYLQGIQLHQISASHPMNARSWRLPFQWAGTACCIPPRQRIFYEQAPHPAIVVAEAHISAGNCSPPSCMGEVISILAFVRTYRIPPRKIKRKINEEVRLIRKLNEGVLGTVMPRPSAAFPIFHLGWNIILLFSLLLYLSPHASFIILSGSNIRHHQLPDHESMFPIVSRSLPSLFNWFEIITSWGLSTERERERLS